MSKSEHEPRTLLRRLLKRAADSQLAPSDFESGSPPADNHTHAQPPDATRSTAPVRPAYSPVQPLGTQPVTLKATETKRTTRELFTGRHGTGSLPIPESRVEQLMKAEDALEKLRQKTAQLATEFAAGKLNRAQFAAMYARYNEMRRIIEQMLSNNPQTQAWRRVTESSAGHTAFLRSYYEALVLAYAVYTYDKDHYILSQSNPHHESPGTLIVPHDVVAQVLAALKLVRHTTGLPQPSGKPIEQARWLVVVPGNFTVTFVMFSLEPSAHQLDMLTDLQRDFERANHLLFERGIFAAEQLVFPQRSLFKRAAT